MQSATSHISVVDIKPGCLIPTNFDVVTFVDLAFQSFGSISLDEELPGLMEGTTGFLAHAVARNPDCLLSHVQRIALHVKRGESGRACGALVDLFIVLGTRGTLLRKRMLNRVKPHVEPGMIEFLTTNLSRGVSAQDVLPESMHSVLTKAVSGTTELVQQMDAFETEARDPLQESRECLEFGQLEAAQRILEAAILREPERVELHRDLLEIYLHTADTESFYHMRGRLQPTCGALVTLWEDTAASFKNAVKQ